MSHRRVRVLHFVTGGFSGGATQVAIQLVNAARDSTQIEPLLVLRRKRHASPSLSKREYHCAWCRAGHTLQRSCHW